jgi:hypothetical protein
LALSEDCAARAREVGVAIIVPWPFVYAPLGAIYGATITLARLTSEFAAQVPTFIDLDPVNGSSRKAEDGAPARIQKGNWQTWVPSEFPWPTVRNA